MGASEGFPHENSYKKSTSLKVLIILGLTASFFKEKWLTFNEFYSCLIGE
jgi:hypothetical protein